MEGIREGRKEGFVIGGGDGGAARRDYRCKGKR